MHDIGGGPARAGVHIPLAENDVWEQTLASGEDRWADIRDNEACDDKPPKADYAAAAAAANDLQAKGWPPDLFTRMLKLEAEFAEIRQRAIAEGETPMAAPTTDQLIQLIMSYDLPEPIDATAKATAKKKGKGGKNKGKS